ncbi:hypothetical protein J6590_051847 [Homalodisca vitripennis]|nr:hypothetical protein J6590_051847 [Homalodisca vitripennis]
MPSLSPTMTEGTIVNWLKKEGEKVSPGDVLCEIQTDKAVMSFETEEEGVLAKILVPSGTKDVKVGTLIALLVGEGEDWKDVAVPGVAGAPAASTPTPAVAQPAFSGGSVPGQEVKMPSLSPTMTEGTIVSWTKNEGDKIAPGDVLCEIQTDKAVMSFETEEEGVLAKILVPSGTKDVKVGSLIALIVGEGEDWKDVAIPVAGAAPAPTPAAATPPSVTTKTAAPSHEPHNYGPAVLRLLEQYQLSSSQVTPTGRNKKLLKGDVLKYIADNNLQPKPPKPVPPPGQQVPAAGAVAAASATETPLPPPKPRTGYTDHELSNMRKTIAKRLTMSKTEIPHAYSQVEAQIDSLLGLRKQLAQVGIKVSLNDFVIKAVALALRQCPYMNTLYINNQTVPHPTVDVSIAVATDAGLITPIIKSADLKSVDQISAEVKELANKARQGKLQLHEFQGGSFTISNLGMFGIAEFSAIINPPQCGILAVGGGRSTFTGDWKAVTLMTSTLSYDGRAVAEDEVAEFMAVLQGYLENPAALMMPSEAKLRVAPAQS